MKRDEAIRMGLELCKVRLGIDGSAVIPELVCAIYDAIEQKKQPKLRDVTFNDLVEGKIFNSKYCKRVQYVGLDHYMGQTTFKFSQLDYENRAYYCLMDALSDFLCQIEDK